MFVDTHIHLSHKLFDNIPRCIENKDGRLVIENYSRQELIDKMRESDIGFVIEPAIEFDSNEKLLSLSREYPDFIYPAVGVHPTRTPQTPWKYRKKLKEIAADKRIIAIGELGLDYHNKRKEQHRLKQKLWFLWQLKLADRLSLPLILHIREADKDAVRLLRIFRKKIHGGICHCFNKGPEIAEIYTKEFRLMLGIGGSLLTANCSELEKAVEKTPLEFLILETDGPYVKPEKPEEYSNKAWGKSRNNSLIIPLIAGRIAEIKNTDISEVEKVTTENAKKLFGIKR